jgi:hypothetical protein
MALLAKRFKVVWVAQEILADCRNDLLPVHDAVLVVHLNVNLFALGPALLGIALATSILISL